MPVPASALLRARFVAGFAWHRLLRNGARERVHTRGGQLPLCYSIAPARVLTSSVFASDMKSYST